jgi:hypothetical protein
MRTFRFLTLLWIVFAISLRAVGQEPSGDRPKHDPFHRLAALALSKQGQGTEPRMVQTQTLVSPKVARDQPLTFRTTLFAEARNPRLKKEDRLSVVLVDQVLGGGKPSFTAKVIPLTVPPGLERSLSNAEIGELRNEILNLGPLTVDLPLFRKFLSPSKEELAALNQFYGPLLAKEKLGASEEKVLAFVFQEFKILTDFAAASTYQTDQRRARGHAIAQTFPLALLKQERKPGVDFTRTALGITVLTFKSDPQQLYLVKVSNSLKGETQVVETVALPLERLRSVDYPFTEQDLLESRKPEENP